MPPPSEQSPPPDVFVTETMAELSARQGRTADAIAIYRRLLDGAPAADERRTRWAARLAALERGAGAASNDTGGPDRAPPSGAAPHAAQSRRAGAAPVSSAAPAPAPEPLVEPALRLPLVLRQPVRSGQIVYAQHTDLIALAPVNPGAQLLADGNIHVYAPLRGRAVAGVRGATAAQIFCLRLEAELVGIDAAYLINEDIPPSLLGRGVRVWLEDGRCHLAPLPASSDVRTPL